MYAFRPEYNDGTLMREGDRLCHHGDEYGRLIAILHPATKEASDYGMPDGGILVDYDGIGLAADDPSDFERVEE